MHLKIENRWFGALHLHAFRWLVGFVHSFIHSFARSLVRTFVALLFVEPECMQFFCLYLSAYEWVQMLNATYNVALFEKLECIYEHVRNGFFLCKKWKIKTQHVIYTLLVMAWRCTCAYQKIKETMNKSKKMNNSHIQIHKLSSNAMSVFIIRC